MVTKKPLTIKERIDENKPYLKDNKNNLKKSDTRKIQLTIRVVIISSKDIDEQCAMH